jgi:hypothetical protein
MPERRWNIATFLAVNAGAFAILGAVAPWAVADGAKVSLGALEMGGTYAIWFVALLVVGFVVVLAAYADSARVPGLSFAGAVVCTVAAVTAGSGVNTVLLGRGVSLDGAHGGLGVTLLYFAAALGVVAAILGARRRSARR